MTDRSAARPWDSKGVFALVACVAYLLQLVSGPLHLTLYEHCHAPGHVSQDGCVAAVAHAHGCHDHGDEGEAHEPSHPIDHHLEGGQEAPARLSWSSPLLPLLTPSGTWAVVVLPLRGVTPLESEVRRPPPPRGSPESRGPPART